MVIAALVASGLLLTGAWLLYCAERRAAESQVYGLLAAHANLQARALEAWRMERLRESGAVLASAPLMDDLSRCLERTVLARDTESVRAWLDSLTSQLRYRGVALTDPRGRPVISSGSLADVPREELAALIRQALETRQAVLTDVRIAADQRTWLAMSLPVGARRAGGAAGAVVFAIDPAEYLGNLRHFHPPVSKHWETLLVARAGDQVLQLNPLEDPAVVRRFDTPGMQLVGGGGLRRLRDYRGVDSVIVSRRVGESHWHVVARMDFDEVLGPANRRFTLTAVAIGAALTCFVFAIGYLVWRHQAQLRLQREAAAEERRALEDHYDRLAKYVNDSVFLADDQMRILDANDRACETYGYSREEFLRLEVRDLRDPSDAQQMISQWEEAGERGSLVFETVHCRKDGSSFPVEVSTRVIDVEGRMYRQSIIRDVTRRKVMEAQLRATLDEFAAVITASPAAIISVNPAGNVKSWNAAAERLFGWTAAEVMGLPVPFVQEEARQESRTILDRALAGETITGLELQRQTKDGRRLDVSLSAAPLRDDAGAAIGVMAVLADVSAQRRAERVLEESEQRFRAAFEQAAVGMAHLAFDGSFLRVNRRLAEIAGYPMAELPRYTLSELIAPEDRDLDRGDAERLRDGRIDTYGVEKRLIRRDGSAIWIRLTFSVVTSEVGEPLHLSAVIEDIEERHRARESSIQSERRFRSVVENAPEGIYIRTGTRIHYANRMALRYFGAEHESDLYGSDVLLRIHSDSHESARERFRRLDAGEVVDTVEEVWTRMDGSTFDVEVSAIPFDHEGQRGALAFFREITARKEADRERKRLMEQFHQSQKMESIGRLAGGIAHDFNNHLTVINGYCSLLLRRLPHNDPSREMIGQVLHAGERSADLIRQLLSFSRKQVVEARATDVVEAIHGLKRLLERLIGEDIRLCIDAAEQTGTVYIDPVQLNQVIMNLAVNARDAMPAGGRLRLQISVVELGENHAARHPDIAPGSYVMIAVSDTGHGMDEDTRARIFEPFFTTKNEAVGTGLGLSTVYGIIRQAGGFISVESAVGKGATFRIYLPRKISVAASGRVESPERTGVCEGRETILVVEDQAELRRLALAILKKLGYDVLEAGEAQSALNLCAELDRPIDLLLTDVIMPGMNGRELAQHLTEAMPALKVLYMSGYTADVITDQGVLEPGLDYLAKPFTPDQLGRKVRAILDAGKLPVTVLVIDDQEGVRGVLRDALTSAGFRVVEAEDGKPAAGILRNHPEIELVITDLVMPEQEGLETIRLIKQERPGLKVIAISGAFEGQFLRTAAFFGADATMAKPIEPDRLVKCVRGLLTPVA